MSTKILVDPEIHPIPSGFMGLSFERDLTEAEIGHMCIPRQEMVDDMLGRGPERMVPRSYTYRNLILTAREV